MAGLMLGCLLSGISHAGEVLHSLPTGMPVPLVLVPAGEFQMGAADGPADQRPVHLVYLDSFYIDKYEVTNAQYAEFLIDTGYREPGLWHEAPYSSAHQPIMDLNWHEMKQFCEWAEKRLPTEAEWEKAARGTDGRANPWGDEALDAGGVYRANYNVYGDRDADGFTWSASVGSFPRGVSPYGAHDMVGNAKEWVEDRYGSRYYESSPLRNPTGPETGSLRVLRGGSWFDFPDFVYATFRRPFNASLPDGDIGGRCACDPAEVVTERPGAAVPSRSWGALKQDHLPSPPRESGPRP